MTFSMLFVAHCEFLFFNPFILINVSNGPKIMHSYYNFFSDETTFQTFRNTQLVRYRRGDPRPCRGMVKHPYKVHSWGAFTAQGPVALFLFTENLNAQRYCGILKSFLIPNISKVGRRWYFQQDNSPIHTSRVT